MLLDIKEIFKSDLDANKKWWSTPKINKINYNFNLLNNGGPAGPPGFKGPAGDIGARGLIGMQGLIGEQGLIGLPGVGNLNPWININNTLLPAFREEYEYQPTRLWLGYNNNTNNNLEDLNIFYKDTLHNIKNDKDRVNLRLKTYGSQNFDFDIYENKIKIGNLNGSNVLEYRSRIYDAQFLRNQNKNLLSITDKINFNSNASLFNNKVKFNNNFKYNNNAISSQIIVSEDNSGKAKWRYKFDVLASFPIGAVISISPEYFNNNNFYIDYDDTKSNTQEIKIKFGRGKRNTAFQGWYLANGQTWTEEAYQVNVPNLNSFTYKVDSNNNNQSSGDTTNNPSYPVMIGGADLNMTVNYINNKYDINLADNSADDIVQFGNSNNANNFTINRKINIIYLKNYNLYWKTSQSVPVTTETIELGFGSTVLNQNAACFASLQQFKWTGIGLNWDNENENLNGVQLYDSNTLLVNPGWYSKNGLAFVVNNTMYIYTMIIV